MTELDELARTLESISLAFDAVGAEWAVGGSLASAAHGEPRATNDVDVVASLVEEEARRFVRELGPDFYADEQSAAAAARSYESFNVIDQRSFIKVDVFVPRSGPLGRDQLERRRTLELMPSVAVPVLGPEDIVLQKLRGYRLGGEVSDRQWRDILAVLRASELDDAYLDDVAASGRLADLLARARREASEP